MRKQLLMPLALLGIAPFLLVSCGDDDDNGDDATLAPTQEQQAETATASPSPRATSSATRPSGGGAVPTRAQDQGTSTPDDEYVEYVDEVCAAGRDFREELEQATDQLTGGNLDDARDTAGQAFGDLRDVFGELDAPDELDAWQEDMEERLDSIATGIEDGDADQLAEAFTSDFPDVPDEAADELRDAAAENEDCDIAAIF